MHAAIFAFVHKKVPLPAFLCFLSFKTISKSITMFRGLQRVAISKSVRNLSSGSLHNSNNTIGFIGLGHMGSKMVDNMCNDGKNFLVFDRDGGAIQKVVGDKVKGGTVESISQKCTVVFSMLPNDKAVEETSAALVEANKAAGSGNKFIHISCSTISPATSRKLVSLHAEHGHTLITAPVFARPDGIAKRQATWMVGGPEAGRKVAAELLTTGGNIVDMGDDVGASNVVKLCGNFLIAVSSRAD